MVAIGDILQGGADAGVDVIHEILHVLAGLHIQPGVDFTVNAVLNKNIFTAGPQVHDEVELICNLVIPVTALKDPLVATGPFNIVASAGGDNGHRLGP